jgi:alpha-galactosidase
MSSPPAPLSSSPSSPPPVVTDDDDDDDDGADDDEWIFTLRFPSSSLSNVEEARPSSPSSSSSGGIRTVQLRQRQPEAAALASGKRHRDLLLRRQKSASPTADSLEEQSSSEQSGENRAERVSLLHRRRQQTGGGTSGSSGGSCCCWTFQSPHWSVEGNTLLTLTYGPAWQVLPEHTARFEACGGSTSPGRACCVRTCGSLSAAAANVAADLTSETFSTADVVRVERLDRFVDVRGVGQSRALRVHLRPAAALHATAPVPPELEGAWERMVQRIKDSRDKLGSTRTATANHKKDEQERDDNSIVGPVITFAVPTNKTDPPLLWKVDLPATEQPVALHTVTVLDGQLLCSPDRTRHEPTHIYINGYQSWSFAGSLVRGQEQPQPALPDVFSRAFNRGGSPPPITDNVIGGTDNCFPTEFDEHYRSDFFTCITSDGKAPATTLERLRQRREFPYRLLDETGGPAVVLGWLSQRQQFGVISADRDLRHFQMHCSCNGQVLLSGVTGSSVSTDWAYCQLIHPHSYDEEPVAEYMHCAAAVNDARPLQRGSLLTGWCSWYVFYEKISAHQLRENFSKLADMRTHVPTNVSVVDDGYMTAWGDWDSLKPNEFPSGLDVVSRDIASLNMRPGLWLAPFAADKHAAIVRQHPDWIIRNDAGVAANSSNCGKFFYGLDATNPNVRAYVHECIRRAVHDWGFSVLKIDFLYAACLEGNGKYDPSMSRAQAMHLALRTIRDAAGPDVFLIGCGCPLATGIGFVDGMRVSGDTGPTWYPAAPLPWWDHGTLPALRSMVRNSMARAPMGHRWWHNDPDCIMLGQHTRLTDDEVASAATIVAMTCGMLLLSDDLPRVPRSRMRIVSKIFPLTGVSAVVLDLHSTNDGLPSLMRLWCTDRYDVHDSFRETVGSIHELPDDSQEQYDHMAEATFYAQRVSFNPDVEVPDPSERQRSCIHVTKGLGTWTVVSISNWFDRSAVVRVPPAALNPPPREDEDLAGFALEQPLAVHGYHVFGFWSSKYSWLADLSSNEENDPDHTVCKKLNPHETEVFHIKQVTPDEAQYIGSDIHFSCGREVLLFHKTEHKVLIRLKTEYRRDGHIFVFLPVTNTANVRVTVNGTKGSWGIAGNVPNAGKHLVGRVIRVAVLVHGDGRPHDGEIIIEF